MVHLLASFPILPTSRKHSFPIKSGETKSAITAYERSGCHRREVPRLLFQAQRISELETYVSTADDPDLYKWFGTYAESMQRFDIAVLVCSAYVILYN